MAVHVFTVLGAIVLLYLCGFSRAADIITQSQSITEGGTLVSKGESFELGFFSPGSSTYHYLGIWYKNIPVQTVIWVANRLNPIKDLSGKLTIDNKGNLVLSSQNAGVVWSSNSTKEAPNPVAQLLDDGNLVLRDREDGNPENYLWQSFDYPSDTLLPGMKLGWDLKAGLNRRLSAWRNSNDPSPGEFTWGIELTNNPEMVLWKGSQMYYRSGSWDGLHSSGAPELTANPVFAFSFISDENEVYYTYQLKNNSVISRMVMNQTTYTRQRYIWVGEDSTWSLYASVPRDTCDTYNLCGAFGNCIIGDSPVCQCLKGFQSKSQETWNPDGWSQGCVRRTELSCQDKDEDGFSIVSGLKLPDTANSWVDRSMNLKDCRKKCLSNCSCTAYSNSDIRGGGSGCAIWYGDLKDIRQISGGGQDLYIRLPAAELGDSHKRTVTVISVVTSAMVSGMLVIAYFICKRRTKRREKMESSVMAGQSTEGREEDLELPVFNLATIAKATNNFSAYNKLGEGGFGAVYRGTLVDGQEIAVKRLSRSSGQGVNEFKNEVKLIAKLQHRNLVKLLGCCIQGEEKMLIYEYMTNKSLDFFIFDQAKARALDWFKRFHIICGLARGLLYLHEDSRLRIIHRDLKASNVLLDSEMNAKISDFGMAKTFGENQTEGSTKRVVGTYGYMAPEYAIDGLFSVKSDVFSFGILLLEIITGKKNRGFYYPGQSVNLIGHAWKMWKEGRPLELIDASLEDTSALSEMRRCIHISLLCVQQYPEDRPCMSSVIMMLGSECSLPEPKEPGFFLGKDQRDAGSPLSKQLLSSTNEITFTILEGR